MALVTFEDYPSTNTPLNAANLNNNFSEMCLKPTVLYSSESGSTGDITLTDSAENYSYIEIFYRSNDNAYNSVKVYQPNNKIVSLQCFLPVNSGPRFYGKLRVVKIANNTISNNSATAYLEFGTTANSSSATIIQDATNNIYITRVLGYNI